MKHRNRIRTKIEIERPEGFGPGARPSIEAAASWVVLVVERRKPWGKDWIVQGRLRPTAGDPARPWTAQPPGVRVPAEPRVHGSLVAARRDAIQLAGVLSGGLYPEERMKVVHT